MANPIKTSNSSIERDLALRIERLVSLNDGEKDYLKSRWLSQFMWMDNKAKSQQLGHYVSRSISLVTGIILLILSEIAFDHKTEPLAIQTIQNWFYAVGTVAAISIAAQSLFKFEERWKHYRRNAELLRSEGWQFIALVGAYGGHASHRETLHIFAMNIESILKEDSDEFVTTVASERPAG